MGVGAGVYDVVVKSSLRKTHSQYPHRTIHRITDIGQHTCRNTKRCRREIPSHVIINIQSVTDGVSQQVICGLHQLCLSQVKIIIITVNNSCCLPNPRSLTSSSSFSWHTERMTSTWMICWRMPSVSSLPASQLSTHIIHYMINFLACNFAKCSPI